MPEDFLATLVLIVSAKATSEDEDENTKRREQLFREQIKRIMAWKTGRSLELS